MVFGNNKQLSATGEQSMSKTSLIFSVRTLNYAVFQIYKKIQKIV